MKKNNLIILVIIGLIVAAIIWKNSNTDSVGPLKTSHPFITDIEKKRIIPGNLYPLTEIEIKSPISGTLDNVFVKTGQKIKIGEKIAQIKLVPDPSKLEEAKSNLSLAKISYDNQAIVFERNKKLFDGGVLTNAEFGDNKKSFDLAKVQYLYAQNQLSLIEKGYIENVEKSNIVKSTTNGTIIDLPLKQGSSIIERNNFNDGTTIAIVARLDTFVFKGKVNETDMVFLRPGMKILLYFNAYKNQYRQAVIDEISAKGVEEQGIMKYYIKAKFGMVNDPLIIRSGYSANAEVILQKQAKAIAIEEKYLQFDNDSAYVTIVKPNGSEQKRYVLTGLSDGIIIQITKGLNVNEKFKIIDK